MTLAQTLAAFAPDMTQWRRDFHAHPELSFEETRTAALVAERLTAMGLTPECGIGGTGVVAVIEGRAPGRSIGLRADMDALPMDDHSGAAHASLHQGASHSCGHDGHTAALLGVARHFAANPPAQGRVVLIFQPAEENGLGARAMIADGLFERFECDEFYAWHNMPLLPLGQAAVHTGPALNGYRVWEIAVEGVGGHGAAPHKTTDPLQAAARLAAEISSIVGRHVDPMAPALVTVTKLQAGHSHNVVPDCASLAGTMRAVDAQVLDDMYARLEAICDGVARMTGCTVTPHVTAGVPPCVNAAEQADAAAAVCVEVFGAGNVVRGLNPYPFTDDMACLLEHRPGAYLFLGQGGPMVHRSEYDFNDALLPLAAEVLVRIAEARTAA
jgi:hippurate hydrolase